jgi:hypothetical protein
MAHLSDALMESGTTSLATLPLPIQELFQDSTICLEGPRFVLTPPLKKLAMACSYKHGGTHFVLSCCRAFKTVHVHQAMAFRLDMADVCTLAAFFPPLTVIII